MRPALRNARGEQLAPHFRFDGAGTLHEPASITRRPRSVSLRYRPAIDTRRGSGFQGTFRSTRRFAWRGHRLDGCLSLCYDLNYFGLIHQNFRVDRSGRCSAAASSRCSSSAPGSAGRWPSSRGQSWRRFWRRWAQIAACRAARERAGSAWMFPRSWISFGILYGIAVMLILARLLAPLAGGLWLVGLLAICLAAVGAAPVLRHTLEQRGRPRHATSR